MDISERIPSLSDKELEALNANAVHLAQAGNAKQREQADALLPLLRVALAERAASRSAALAEQRVLAAERRAQTRASRKAEP